MARLVKRLSPDKLYWYDDAGGRDVVVGSYPDIRSDKQVEEA